MQKTEAGEASGKEFARKAVEVRFELLRKIGEAVEQTDTAGANALPNLTRCLKEINDLIQDELQEENDGGIFEQLADTVHFHFNDQKTEP